MDNYNKYKNLWKKSELYLDEKLVQKEKKNIGMDPNYEFSKKQNAPKCISHPGGSICGSPVKRCNITS